MLQFNFVPKVACSLLCALLFVSCAGPTLQELKPNQSSISLLGNEEREEVERIRQAQMADDGVSPQVKNFINEAEHLSSFEYLNSPYYSPEIKGENYRIGGKDILRIDVYEEPDLSKESVTVTENGTITLPLLGQIQITGLTTPELESILEKQYSDKGILLDPQVSVSIAG